MSAIPDGVLGAYIVFAAIGGLILAMCTLILGCILLVWATRRLVSWHLRHNQAAYVADFIRWAALRRVPGYCDQAPPEVKAWFEEHVRTLRAWRKRWQ